MGKGFALVAAVVLAAAGAGGVRSEARSPGKLVFRGETLMQRDNSTQDGLYVENADGTGLTHLTHAFGDEEPHWSPDGSTIAFSNSRSSGDAVFEIGADGSGRRLLGKGDEFGKVLSSAQPWSADGTRIAWVGCRGLCVHDVRANTTRSVPIAAVTGNGFGWSPDGASIAVTDVAKRLLVVPAAGGTARVVARGAESFPTYSPDGATIAFLAAGDVEVVPAAGGTPRVLAADANDVPPVWSPDGRSLLYLGNAPDNRSDALVEVVDVASGARRTLTRTTAGTSPPVWSPDGSSVAYTDTRWRGGGSLETDVWVVGADGRGSHPITAAFPTGAEYGLLDTIDWTSGTVPVTPSSPQPVLALTPDNERTDLWVDGLGRGPTADSVAYSHELLCDPDAETTTTVVATWSLSKPLPSEAAPPCGNYEGGTDFAVTSSLVAWRGELLVSVQQDLRTFVGVARVGARPERKELRRWLGFVEDELGHARYLGALVGDGTTISFETFNDRVENRTLVRFNRRLYRIADGGKPHAVRTPLPPDATDVVDAADGRILLGATHGRLLVVSVHGGVVGRIPSHGPTSARIGGDRVGTIEGAWLVAYDLHGNVRRRLPVSNASGPPRLLTIRGDYAVYASGIAFHLVRLDDGSDRVISLPDQGGPVDALLTPRGLFLSYNQAYGVPPGRVEFVSLPTLEGG